MAMEKLYDGSVELVFNEKKHLYSVDGVIIPSVTRVIGVIDKPALVPWAVKETVTELAGAWQPGVAYTQEQIDAILADSKSARFRTSKAALNIGSEAHDWLERYIKAQILLTAAPTLPEYPPVLAAVNSYIEWEKHRSYLRYIYSERKVYSVKHMFSGTVDLVMEANGSVIVGDFKTSKGIYPEYLVQSAAYAKALEEELGISVDRIAVIRIPKDGNEVEIEISDNVDELFEVFLSCLTIWRWKNEWSPDAEKWTLD